METDGRITREDFRKMCGPCSHSGIKSSGYRCRLAAVTMDDQVARAEAGACVDAVDIDGASSERDQTDDGWIWRNEPARSLSQRKQAKKNYK